MNLSAQIAHCLVTLTAQIFNYKVKVKIAAAHYSWRPAAAVFLPVPGKSLPPK